MTIFAPNDRVYISNHRDGVKGGTVVSVNEFDIDVACDDGDRWIAVPDDLHFTREEAEIRWKDLMSETLLFDDPDL